MLPVPLVSDPTGRQPISRNRALGPNAARRIHCTEDARQLARRRIPRMMFGFVDGSAGNGIGERRNRSAMDETRLQPRFLRPGDELEISVSGVGVLRNRVGR